MTADRDGLAAILAKHQPRSVAYRTGWEARCSGCDWVGSPLVQTAGQVTDLHRAHVARMVLEAGYHR